MNFHGVFFVKWFSLCAEQVKIKFHQLSRAP